MTHTNLPVAVSATFVPSGREIVVEFDNETKFIFPVDNCERLKGSSNEQLQTVVLLPGRAGKTISRLDSLSWPELGVDLKIPYLMQGVFGEKA